MYRIRGDTYSLDPGPSRQTDPPVVDTRGRTRPGAGMDNRNKASSMSPHLGWIEHRQEASRADAGPFRPPGPGHGPGPARKQLGEGTPQVLRITIGRFGDPVQPDDRL